ncbi:1-aminocyclopropane-1-carboxylate deaminase/D-cysteine desulfhydrase [Methylobacter sp. BBA5.1]|jgi:1-aminocyclopropane-1-carboxylate deaminase/D-cysteine desulfhydrase-like pyridoxal-dependent ACC family enzyme|uniref:1-aminocyclopropane-1-carboxylate deaminase/D-cysteine desulfhydrase n=1 Tax=Methylobacter sp. BBA5.1 TaxID=1495064 RepID=UPI0005666D3B|nr:pyridoxal-phosphate dependent enzyme [Methylobacter sp. BBA5.1]
MHPELIQLEKTFDRSILSRIPDPLIDRCGVELWIKRDDLLHPVISGNKWRKLKYILDHALSSGAHTLISMGGAYSNHLHALAFVGRALGMKTIGLVRGERPDTLNPTLADMQHWGMELRFVSRYDYRSLRQYKGWQDLPGIGAGQYWLPEGGAQALALKGVMELALEIKLSYDVICAPCGTGATLAGIIEAAPEPASVIGFAALKNARFLTADIERLLSGPRANWQVNLDYHFGGFAQVTDELLAFIDAFELKTQVPLEPVYTGKMLYGLYDLMARGCFKPGQRIIAVHTGGLQGKRGFDR